MVVLVARTAEAQQLMAEHMVSWIYFIHVTDDFLTLQQRLHQPVIHVIFVQLTTNQQVQDVEIIQDVDQTIGKYLELLLCINICVAINCFLFNLLFKEIN